MNVSRRFHEVDLALEALIGNRVQVRAHKTTIRSNKNVEIPGFRGVITALKWSPVHKQHYFLIRDKHNRIKVAPARCVPAAAKIIKGGTQ